MHSIWSGNISFGLVNIPIRLYSGSSRKRLGFDLLREGDHCPISYVRVCDRDGKEVDWEDIVKGYEIKKNYYVVLDEEDFEKAAPEESHNIEIISFVDISDISPKYFKKPYLIEPEKDAEKSYSLLRETMKNSSKVGIAKFVMKKKEHLVALIADEKLLSLIDLRFEHELRETDGLNLPGRIKHSRQEKDMAKKLIQQMESKFEPGRFKDTYNKKLKEILKAKAKDEEIKTSRKKARRPPTKDLLKQLKKSLN